MPCAHTPNWKVTSIVGAFLDLVIAFMFLCTSVFVHLALTFIGFLGFPLLSYHSGRFGAANKGRCLQRHLVDCALERVSAVDLSVRSKIPFDSITDDDLNQCFELKLVRRHISDASNSRIKSEDLSRFLPKEQEAEDVSRERHNVTNNGRGGLGLMGIQGGTKSKRFVTRRSRTGLRNHRRSTVGSVSLPTISSFDVLQNISETTCFWPRPSDERSPEASNFEEIVDGKNAADEISLQQNLFNGSEFDEHQEKDKDRETEASIHEQIKCNSSGGQSFDRNAENVVKILEKALEEERVARATACVELEKERNAAASAVDEAMGMILRLQDEKASIEMEARQFQRMVEEKSTFDAEEMNILKDILLQREREKHFLEKEVEAYRQLLDEADEFESSKREDPDQMSIGGIKSSTEGEKTEKQGDKHKDCIQNPDLQERRALLVQGERKEPDKTVLDLPYIEDNKENSRALYKSDSEVAYSRVRDVYVVKDDANIVTVQNIDRKNQHERSRDASKPESSWVLEMARRLPPLCRPRRTLLNSSGSRRKSMTAVDYERLKIENEVELLRERLRTVQEGREKITRRASLTALSSKVKVTSETRSSGRSSLDIHSS